MYIVNMNENNTPRSTKICVLFLSNTSVTCCNFNTGAVVVDVETVCAPKYRK